MALLKKTKLSHKATQEEQRLAGLFSLPQRCEATPISPV